MAEPDEPVPPWRRRALGLFLAVLAVAWVLSTVRTEVNQRRLNDQQQQIEKDLRADCPFKLDIVRLPEAAIASTGRPPSATLIRLAEDARQAYIGKGCPEEIDPDTGKPFGPPPQVQTR